MRQLLRQINGFSLVELIVVVLIIGIVVAWGIPLFTKAVESSKADAALSMARTIASAHRMYAVNNGRSYIQGQFNSPSGWCQANRVCGNLTDNLQCQLISCGYMADQDWAKQSYRFYACDGPLGGPCCSGTMVACARRGGGAGVYASWGYDVDKSDGKVTPVGGAPGVPN